MKLKTMLQLLLIIAIATLIGIQVASAGKKEAEAPDKPDSASIADQPKMTETMVVNWPEDEKWMLDYFHEGKGSEIQIFYPAGQSTSYWEEMIIIEKTLGKNKNIVGIARETYLGTVRGSPNATWDILKKGANEQKRPFVLYEIICPDFLSGEPPQVQLWKMIIGETALFTLQYSYRGEEMPKDRREQIIEILDNAYLKVEEE